MPTFKIIYRTVLGCHEVADIIRIADGQTIRSGLYPQIAEDECKLLERLVAGEISKDQYFTMRKGVRA